MVRLEKGESQYKLTTDPMLLESEKVKAGRKSNPRVLFYVHTLGLGEG